ncbi:unnamed protein product [Closterium sp. NIES-65]|nr:unnamed protein product [Closterium sp. NIES-65]
MDRGGGPTRVLRAQQPLQHSLVVTVSVIMTACLALMYMLVSRHLASMDQIALALTESISEQTTNQAVEVKALVAALENHTYSVAAAVTDHVAVQTVQLRQLAAELRNHSHFVREHVGQHVDAQQAQLAEVVAELRARMGEVASAVMAPPAPPLPDSAITSSNLTLLVAAGLRSQVGGCHPRWVGAIPGGWVPSQVGGCHPRWVGAIPGGWVPSQVRCGGHPRCAVVAIPGALWWPSQVPGKLGSHGVGCEGVGPVDGQHRWL